MKWQYLLAKRIYKRKEEKKEISKPAIRIAMIGIAIGLAVMLVSVSIVLGFKHQVRDKIVGLGSDMTLTNLQGSGGEHLYQTEPLTISPALMATLQQLPEIAHIQRYVHKSGMIMTSEAFQGFMLKGVAQEYDWTFLKAHLLEGEIPLYTDSVASNKVLISRSLSDKLHLSLGDKIDTYYIEERVRIRRLEIAGIYQTAMPAFDDFFLITDLYTATRLQNWEAHQVGGIEIACTAPLNTDLDAVREAILPHISQHLSTPFLLSTVEETYPQIFAWLSVLDTNVWVILVLMIAVSGFTMISGLLIIILEHTQMIGLLKALGANNRSIRQVFLIMSVFVIGRGMLIGNTIALIFFFVQSQWKIFSLDPTIYYLEAVPISFGWGWYLLVNVLAFCTSVLMLIAPSYLISRIHPARSIRFE